MVRARPCPGRAGARRGNLVHKKREPLLLLLYRISGGEEGRGKGRGWLRMRLRRQLDPLDLDEEDDDDDLDEDEEGV